MMGYLKVEMMLKQSFPAPAGYALGGTEQCGSAVYHVSSCLFMRRNEVL